MSKSRRFLRFAALTDVGKVKLINEDALYCDDDLGLFLVSDGLGGLPAGEAASQIVAAAFPHALRSRITAMSDPQPTARHELLRDVIVDINRGMYDATQHVPTLKRMGATFVAALFEDRSAHFIHVGDSRAYLLRRKHFLRLTIDHSAGSRLSLYGVKSPLLKEDPQMESLLLLHVGMATTLKPDLRTMDVQKGDRLLLCSDGLSAVIDDQTIGTILLKQTDVDAAAEALMQAANNAGGPDNITIIVIDCLDDEHGKTMIVKDERGTRLPAPGTKLKPIIGELQLALQDLQRDLQWLHKGAKETSQDSRVASLAAAKRLLGGQAYLSFMQKHPSTNPAHVFHQFCAAKESHWRRTYERHKAVALPLIEQIVDQDVPVSCTLNADETGQMFRRSWEDLLRVEKRYLNVCKRPAINSQERSTEVLVEQMLLSVQTLIGLTEFLPRFVV